MTVKRFIFVAMLLLLASLGLYAQTNALNFDGNDNVAMGDLGFTGTTYTAEAWIYPTSLVTTQPAYCNTILASSSTLGNYPMWFGTNGNNIRVWSYSTNNTNYQTTVGLGLAVNNWYHIAMTTTKGGLTKLYVNGVEKLSYTNAGAGVNWTPQFTVGDLRPGRGFGFKGKILDVRVWSVVRTPAEIVYGMNNDLLGTEVGLIGYWPFHEGSGTTVLDHQTNGPLHHGALGTVASTQDPNWTSGMQAAILDSFNPAVAAMSVARGTYNHPIFRFTIEAALGSALFDSMDFTTGGSYLPTDIGNFKLWYNTVDDLSSAVQVGTTITAGLGVGNHTFSGLGHGISSGTKEYFWITSDIQLTAVAYNFINVSAVTTGALSIPGSFKTGFTQAGANQTFDITLPVELSSFTAVPYAQSMVKLTWVTQTETGVSGYVIYRGTNSSITEAAQISSLIEASNTSYQQTYSFIDNELTDNGTYYYWLQSRDLDGSSAYHGPVIVEFGGIDNPGTPDITERTALRAVYPNPFNPTAYIKYYLAEAAGVTVNIYNSRGQLIRTFDDGIRQPGEHQLVWDGRDNRNVACSTGVYFFRMISGDQTYTRKALMIK